MAEVSDETSEWTVYITNDNCPDYTWGYTEEQTRQSFADVVRGHLDEMKRTDSEAAENQDRYNMAVTQEALCFVERYPERKDELIQRIKEGRIYVSPYLCNALWAFQSFESAIRTFYPARRLEKEWGISFDIAEHIEEPSLPWGVASILAGCGIRWLSSPFLVYDSNFKELKNPPLFIFEGPDGSQIKVVMDPWACLNSAYSQGRKLLQNRDIIMQDWLPHYQKLGESYPFRVTLASGTHGDISPRSGDQARGFADAIIEYNNSPGEHPKLVNAILPQFCEAVDEADLEVVRGCFGHSWDLWPVCLAKYVAGMREGDRAFLATEALLTVASQAQPELMESTRSQRERCEWLWAMLSDHAWNGTGDENKRHNAYLRRKWSEELREITDGLIQQGWDSLGIEEDDSNITVFNSLSIPRTDLVRVEVSAGMGVSADDENIESQNVEEDGKNYLYFVSPEIPGFGIRKFELNQAFRKGLSEKGRNQATEKSGTLKATPAGLESPYYRLSLDAETGGVSNLVHKPTGAELITGAENRTLCQTVYFDGEEHLLTSVESQVVANGPVLARLRVTGTIEGMQVVNFITVYAHLDRVDFDLRITKPVTTKEERLCQIFPILQDEATLRVETTGAVIRPQPQPEGDLLPGADTRRFAVQGFVDASTPDGVGVTVATLDAYVLRLDLDSITFEALGNDQNYREVSKNQDGVTDFRFRYSLKAHTEGYDNAETLAWSRRVATPLMVARGASRKIADKRSIVIEPGRAVATCLKPADDDGHIVRLWETGGQSGLISIDTTGYARAFRTDLLERDIEELPMVNGRLKFDLNSYGFAGLRLLP